MSRYYIDKTDKLCYIILSCKVRNHSRIGGGAYCQTLLAEAEKESVCHAHTRSSPEAGARSLFQHGPIHAEGVAGFRVGGGGDQRRHQARQR